MSRKKIEINPIRAERLKMLCKREKLRQIDLVEIVHMRQQNISKMMVLKTAVTDETIRLIHERFPQYRVQWLKGDDDYMTNADLFLSMVNSINENGKLLNNGFLSFAMLNGYQIDYAPVYGNNSIEKTIQNIKKYCTISKDGKSLTLSLAELDDFQNEICDYVAFRLEHMMK